MDAGIIRCFKSNYRKRFIRLALDRDDAGFDNIYKIDQQEAMQLAAEAWNAVSPATIRNCWRHTGIVPLPTVLPAPLPVPLPPPPAVTEDQSLEDEIAGHPRMLDSEFLERMDSLTLDGPTEEERTDEEIVDLVDNDLTGLLD